MVGQTNFQIECDNNGYIDFQCNNEECCRTYKIHRNSYEKIIDPMTCPYCGLKYLRKEMFTEEQANQINEYNINWARKLVMDELGKSFMHLENSTRGNKTVKIKYIPSKQIYLGKTQIVSGNEWEYEVNCNKCNSKYMAIGCGFFCPVCGNNNITEIFIQAMKSIENIVIGIPNIVQALQNSFNEKEVEIMRESMLEAQFKEVVSSFHKYLFDKFRIGSSKSVRANDFQIISKAHTLYYDCYGINIFENTDQLKLNNYFQMRHCLEHSRGIVDSKLLEKSSLNLMVGQKIKIDCQDILDFRNEVIEVFSHIERNI